MNKVTLSRRSLLKAQATAVAAAAAGIALPAEAQNLITEKGLTDLKWSKAACRFCGTGCSVMVATRACSSRKVTNASSESITSPDGVRRPITPEQSTNT